MGKESMIKMTSIPSIMQSSRLRIHVILRLVGWLLVLEGLMMSIPLVMSIFTRDGALISFLVPMLITLGIGLTSALANRNASTMINRREAYLLTTIIWILYSAFGMIPFIMGTNPLSVTDAFFETMSGFTTTGASMISDVESHTHSLLLWRSMIQWIGGLGIILFILAVIPALNQSGGISMFNAEITGITHDKLHPRIRSTAASLWAVYLILTIAQILLLWIGPMNLFDSVCHSFTTMATGGFSTRNASIAGFNSPYTAWIISIFMFLGGTNFVLIYGAARGRIRQIWHNDVFRTYLLIIIVSILVIDIIQLCSHTEANVESMLLNPVFQIVSTISSTGFNYIGFDTWGNMGLTVIILLMLCGACAGSTTSGIKVDRIVALFKHLRNEINLTIYPHRMKYVEVCGRVLSSQVMSRVVGFIVLYMLLLSFGTLWLTACGINFTDAFFATASCIGNNGLGYGVTASSYAAIADSSKWILSALMLTGRLELFTVMVLLTRSFWRA